MNERLKIERRKLRSLLDFPDNPNRHPRRQLAKLAKVMGKVGFIGVIVINRKGFILAGHARRQAALMAGIEEVDCLVVEHLTEAEERAFVLADNRIGLDATADVQLVSLQLDKILAANPDFDLSLTGHDADEIDRIVLSLNPEDAGPSAKDEALPEVQDGPPISKLGDLIRLGRHFLCCGDSREVQTYIKVMTSELAAMVISDPPYNVRVSTIGSSGRIKHREFAMGSGEMTREEFVEFLRTVFANLVAFSVDGSIHFQCIDWKHLGEMLAAGESVYSALKNVCVWDKGVGGMGTMYRSRHEMVFVWKAGTAQHINNFGLGDKGRYRTNVWNYRGLNTGGAGRLEELALHPTAKPVQMLADAMLDCSVRNSIVLDPFGGSGSTLIAAEKTGRRARIIELDPVYVDRMVRRWQKWAKEDAVFVDTGETFDERQAHQAELRLLARPIVRPGASPTSRIVDFSRELRP
jgi:DNA modification methylase